MMYISHFLLTTLAATSTVQAFNVAKGLQTATQKSKLLYRSLYDLVEDVTGSDPKTCPDVWQEISTTLTAQFLADGQCTDAARAAIRSSFHDCFNGACDGSLILAAGECTNPENAGIERLCDSLKAIVDEKAVGAADLIQFAAAHAVKTCPGGPTIPVKIGRTDSSEPGALGILPTGRANAADMVKLFASKGFTPEDLAALIGAHTAAKQRTTDPSQAGKSLDSTPGQWDNKYFQETKTNSTPFTLPVDKGISEDPATKDSFSTFAESKGAWDAAFVPAMVKMSMLGVTNQGDLIDCTSALPGGSLKREIRNSNIFDRFTW